MRDAAKTAAEGAREGFTEASKSRKNQDDIDEEKHADDRDKEKQRNHDKGKTIRKRREDCNKDRKSDLDEAKI